MSDLAAHVEDYLRLRRALGFRLEREGQVLPQFAAYLAAAGATSITTELAISWARLAVGVQPISLSHRLGAVRGLARYLATIDPATEVPPRDVLACRAGRPVPHLYSEAELERLVAGARALRPPLRAATHEALLGLLATSGMRVGEALGLLRDDVDLREGVLSIRRAKGSGSRLVPLHPSTTKALAIYAERRRRLCPRPSSSSFFISVAGTALSYDCVRRAFIQITSAIGLGSASARPRIHDLRHTFAVRTLIEWQRSGADPAGRLGLLSLYLGHVNPAGTYWYLSAAPELMELAAARLSGPLGERP